MGLQVKTKGDLFRVLSSISDESIHNNDWVELDVVKRELVNRRFFDFIQECIKIDFDFPKGYYVDGVQGNSSDGLEYLINHTGAEVFEYVEKMFKRLGIQMDFTERKQFNCADGMIKEYLDNGGKPYMILWVSRSITNPDISSISVSDNVRYHTVDFKSFYKDIELTDELNDIEVCYLKDSISKFRDASLKSLDICDNILK